MIKPINEIDDEKPTMWFWVDNSISLGWELTSNLGPIKIISG